MAKINLADFSLKESIINFDALSKAEAAAINAKKNKHFLIANNELYDFNFLKLIEIREEDSIYLFNRFLLTISKDLIDIIKFRNKNNFLFTRAGTAFNFKTNKIDEIDYIKNSSSFPKGVYGLNRVMGGCICCYGEKIFNNINKIFTIDEPKFIQQGSSCDNFSLLEDKFIFLNPRPIYDQIIKYHPELSKKNFSTGLWMYGYLRFILNVSNIYLIGFDSRKGREQKYTNFGHCWKEEKAFFGKEVERGNVIII